MDCGAAGAAGEVGGVLRELEAVNEEYWGHWRREELLWGVVSRVELLGGQ